MTAKEARDLTVEALMSAEVEEELDRLYNEIAIAAKAGEMRIDARKLSDAAFVILGAMGYPIHYCGFDPDLCQITWHTPKN